MKYLLISLGVIFLSSIHCSSQQSQKSEQSQKSQQPESASYVVLAYVTSWSSVMPDPDYVTHISYAFGHVNEKFNGIMFAEWSGVAGVTCQDRLRSIVGLKKQKPSLKVMLAIGGWGSGRFSEMAADEKNRKAFAADCQRVILEFGLDGIDMDWEYPTNSEAKISSSPNDTKNFTLLMRDIREAIGKEKLLTFASASSARFIDFKAVNPYVDFVNIMTYDINTEGSAHHAGLYRSKLTGNGFSCKESVDKHVAAGIPINKLTLGIPFYGRGRDSIPNYIDYRKIINRNGVLGIISKNDETMLKSYTEKWDEAAQAPYWVDADGKFVLSYETPRSIALKCDFLKKKGMLGAMYWDYAADDEEGTLRKAVFHGVISK